MVCELVCGLFLKLLTTLKRGVFLPKPLGELLTKLPEVRLQGLGAKGAPDSDAPHTMSHAI